MSNTLNESPATVDDPLAKLADDLCPGWMFFSPAGRWETISDVQYSPNRVRIFTTALRDGYSWSLYTTQRVKAIPAEDTHARRVVIVETTTGIFVTVTDSRTRSGALGYGEVLAQGWLIRGQGWRLVDRPDGGALTETVGASKAAVRTAMRRSARAHAKALGLEILDLGTGAL